MNSDYLADNWIKVKEQVEKASIDAGRTASEVRIVAVSKTYPPDVIRSASSFGVQIIGENYVQELKDKYENLSELEIEWHFIGHLQSNKVKYIAPFIANIHTVDSLKLAEEISLRAEQNGRIIHIMIQINTSGEASKSGCKPYEAVELAGKVAEMEAVELKGLMTIGTFSDDESISRREFSLLRNTLDRVNTELRLSLTELSMGMSHDFVIAIQEGATYVRIGTAIFGARNYI